MEHLDQVQPSAQLHLLVVVTEEQAIIMAGQAVLVAVLAQKVAHPFQLVAQGILLLHRLAKEVMGEIQTITAAVVVAVPAVLVKMAIQTVASMVEMVVTEPLHQSQVLL